MKTTFAILLSTAVFSQAALIPLGISPAGSSAAVGLSPTNEVPPLTGSGSGGVLGGGVIFDESTFTLHLSVGCGSATGFTDLTGPATGAGIFGPAQTNQTAALLVDLESLTFPAANPADGGIIFGDVVYATNDVPGLLAGLDYINIATTNNPDGEIRGQLIPLDLPPILTCPDPVTVECSKPVTLSVEVGDQVGNSMDVVWSLNTIPVQTNSVPAFNPPASTNVEFTATLPIGTNNIQVTAVSAIGSTATCNTTVTVVDTNPPVIVSASPSPCSLWPPNHKMVKVTVTAQVTDDCSATTWKIICVKSNESVNGKGDGNTSPDWKILNNHCLDLRAERSGNGNGRIYTITIQAQDAAGNLSATKNITVTVPKSQGQDKDKGKSSDKDNGKGNGKK
jgi:hypothetical protein